MSTQVQTKASLISRARAAPTGTDCYALYDEWAATYDDDVTSQDYVGPMYVAQAALRSDNYKKGWILDAGCGTGLVGELLARGGAMTIDGLDLSPAMLKIAEKTGVYRSLDAADLTRQVDKPDGTYDIITCAGTFTEGHVGPEPALREFVRITKSNGIIVATVLDKIWLSGGYKAEVEKLEAEGLVKVISADVKDYVKGRGDTATVIVLEKIGRA